jgi:protein-glucosylgalactosylhydroxylysine glucosidase
MSAIDRESLVRRHNVTISAIDPKVPLSVGNGELAFTVDATGLQTFPDAFLKDTPLCTMSQWGWHSFPEPKDLLALRYTEYDAHGRTVRYATSHTGQDATFDYLRKNPHRLHLGQIGFRLHLPDGRTARIDDVKAITQTLDLWTGTITSRFSVSDRTVEVRTCCHPTRDLVDVSVSGDSLDWLSVIIQFPGASPDVAAADWNHPQLHTSRVLSEDRGSLKIQRQLDNDSYAVHLTSNADIVRNGDHEWELSPEAGAKQLWFSCEFTRTADVGAALDEKATSQAVIGHWKNFWSTGGAIDLSGSTDPRWKELERRIVLSQYLTAIQCAGSLPPQETGLTCNSWGGKFHLEMHWWHAAHFALWNRAALLERSLGWYASILPSARERAKFNGYSGARWPKMTDPSGRDSPSPIGPLLIWEQPHPIMYAQLCYRAHPDDATLHRYFDIVQATAEFMASYAVWEDASQRYMLGPPVIPAQENHPPRETWNPTFELSYWRFGLRAAQDWRRRMKLEAVPLWDQVIAKLSPLPTKDGVYLAHENCPQTFTERNRDHPSMLAALGMLPGDSVDPAVMRRTLDKVMTDWRWDETWGWDCPMAAMTAARLGDGKLAVDLLLKDTAKNRFGVNGHNYQRPGLTLYLPGNGALLAATAMMAGGWWDGPKKDAPGFPDDGTWVVKHEGFLPIL